MPPKGPEYQLQSQVAQLAAMLGWEHVAFRVAFTKGRGWRTPGTGTMAKGWPDMTLVRARDRRLIFAELKSDVTKPSPDQDRVLDVLRALELPPEQRDALDDTMADMRLPDRLPSIEVYVWRPRDFDQIERILR